MSTARVDLELSTDGARLEATIDGRELVTTRITLADGQEFSTPLAALVIALEALARSLRIAAPSYGIKLPAFELGQHEADKVRAAAAAGRGPLQ